MMKLAAWTENQPELEWMIKILFIEALNDETAVVSLSLDRVIAFFHLSFTREDVFRTLNDIEGARILLKRKMNAIHTGPSTISYYIDGILNLLFTNNETMPALNRIIIFVACYIHSGISHIPNYKEEKTVRTAKDFVRKRLTKEPINFYSLKWDVIHYLEEFAEPNLPVHQMPERKPNFDLLKTKGRKRDKEDLRKSMLKYRAV